MNALLLAISFIVGGAVASGIAQSSVLTGLSLSLEPTTPAQHMTLSMRTALTGFPVPTFRPSTANTVLALDLMPNGSPAQFLDNGYTWLDACDTDILSTTGIPVTCARVGIRSDRVEFGARYFDGGTAKPVHIAQNGTGYIIVEPSGQIELVSLATYADNAAATAGGVPVNGLYRTSAGAVMVRF